MEQHIDLSDFLTNYFETKQCTILSREQGQIHIQLTEEMDKELMNRPFYWHYIKKIGREGEPQTLRLITDKEKTNEPGEWIHFGSPRLHQIINKLIEKERYTRLFEQVRTSENTPLYPWLVVNIKISYLGVQHKDEIFSVGLQLLHGHMTSNMMDFLENMTLDRSISDYCYTLTPMITPKSGFLRIQNLLRQHVQNQDNAWAVTSIKQLETEKATLKHFYEDELDHPRYLEELEALEKRFKPRITFQVINGGIFYLTASSN
ncbi:YqhG family protein [Oceanobacillus sp. CFH 90083]|uniref:YqhG family protein n=1 Tax=Oceanobacillus sp. CFH 90083 TaxID=2592336 RepID=UPI00128C1A05|nr:YqhG family protein [Oceanobacillus sp. CFH 90083]